MYHPVCKHYFWTQEVSRSGHLMTVAVTRTLTSIPEEKNSYADLGNNGNGPHSTCLCTARYVSKSCTSPSLPFFQIGSPSKFCFPFFWYERILSVRCFGYPPRVLYALSCKFCMILCCDQSVAAKAMADKFKLWHIMFEVRAVLHQGSKWIFWS